MRKKLINVTIKYDRVSSQSFRGPYFDLRDDNILIDFCIIDLKCKYILSDFDTEHLELLDIKEGDFESYRLKFKELGFDLYDFEN